MLGLPAIPGSYFQPARLPEKVLLAGTRSGSTLPLAWPVAAAGFTLQARYDFLLTVQWQPVTNGIASDGTNHHYQAPPTEAEPIRFFRLIKN